MNICIFMITTFVIDENSDLFKKNQVETTIKRIQQYINLNQRTNAFVILGHTMDYCGLKLFIIKLCQQPAIKAIIIFSNYIIKIPIINLNAIMSSSNYEKGNVKPHAIIMNKSNISCSFIYYFKKHPQRGFFI